MVIWLPTTKPVTEPGAVPAATVPFCGRPAAPTMSTVQPGGANSSAAAAGRAFSAKDGRRRAGGNRPCGWSLTCMESPLEDRKDKEGKGKEQQNGFSEQHQNRASSEPITRGSLPP